MVCRRIAQMRNGDRRGTCTFRVPPVVFYFAARSPPDLPTRCQDDGNPGKVGQMAVGDTTESMVNVLRDTIVALVRQDGPDLSARQFGVFLTCYLEGDAQTVRGLAAALDVSKP